MGEDVQDLRRRSILLEDQLLHFVWSVLCFRHELLDHVGRHY